MVRCHDGNKNHLHANFLLGRKLDLVSRHDNHIVLESHAHRGSAPGSYMGQRSSLAKFLESHNNNPDAEPPITSAI